MAGQADYWISHKRLALGTKHISHLLVHVADGTPIGQGVTWTREQVIFAIENHQKTFATIIWRNGQWHRGADVHLVPINWDKFLRTDPNQTAADNLDNLPDF